VPAAQRQVLHEAERAKIAMPASEISASAANMRGMRSW
jgi:hypothetical protein